MNKRIGNINIKFGWFWLFIGLLQAIWIGLYAFSPEWLGGYASLSRRLLRLSHIAFMALSLTNILYGLCIDSVNLSKSLKKIGSYSMIIAAISMPTICLLTISNNFFELFFFIPSLSFACGLLIMALGQIKRVDS